MFLRHLIRVRMKQHWLKRRYSRRGSNVQPSWESLSRVAVLKLEPSSESPGELVQKADSWVPPRISGSELTCLKCFQEMIRLLIRDHNFENHRVRASVRPGPSHLKFISKVLWTFMAWLQNAIPSCAPTVRPLAKAQAPVATFHLSAAGKQTKDLRMVRPKKQVRRHLSLTPAIPLTSPFKRGQKSPLGNHFLFEETHNYPQRSQHHSFCSKINTSRWEWYRTNLSQDLWNLHFF